MIIRAKTFRAWFNANLKGSARDIANHGADCGFPHITYTADCAYIFDHFSEEIWEMVVDDANDFGQNPCEMIANFGRKDMAEGSFSSFKNLLLWYACEKVAHEMVGDEE